MKQFFRSSKKKNISDKKGAPRQDDKFIPDELALKKIGEKRISPLNDPVWKASLSVVAGSAVIWFLHLVIGISHPVFSWFIALISLFVWVTAVKMLLLDAKFKRIWVGWLLLSFVLPLIVSPGQSIWMAAVGGTFVFLLFRKYKPYRHLTSRRRAALFLMGFFVLILLGIGRGLESTAESEELLPEESQTELSIQPEETGLGAYLGRYAEGSLELFWLFSLLHIFFRARLHFMKLKPKLAISAMLIAVVPLILVILMGFLILFGTLGASRAIQARSILDDWRSLSATDENFIPNLFPQSFTYDNTGMEVPRQQETPPWLQDLLTSLAAEGTPLGEEREEEVAEYIWIESGLWLIRIDKVSGKISTMQGGKVDQSLLSRLAKIVRTDVSFVFSSSVKMTIAGTPIRLVQEEEGKPIDKLFAKYVTPSSRSFWHRPLYFGMTDIDVFSLASEKLESRKMLLLLEVILANTLSELTSQKNPFSLVVMIVLMAMAVLMLIFEAFALFFGVRITTGFTSAVRSLYQGTKRIAAGDLDSNIQIPNEDELGDLAASFNAMSLAVKKGREEAILRAHLESELDTARKIQEKLLPHKMPRFHGFEIAGTSIPSKQVGGDYFDFLDLGEGQLGIAIADVSGKGIPAALLMANLQASLHAQTFETEKVADVTARINDLLVKSTDSNMFVTFFYGLLDRNRSTFTSTNAGHNHPLLLRSDQTMEFLTKGGLVLGFLPDQKYDQQTTTLQPGDVLVLYTDGITEARTPDEEEAGETLFGEDRLVRVIEENAILSAREIQAAILNAVSEHTKNTPQGDDITLVVIKRRKA